MPITADSIPFLQPGSTWPPPGELGADRLERYTANKRLFRGRHELVYKDWIRLLREDQRATLEIIVNFPGAVSKLFADLLLGETPKFAAGDDGAPEQAWLDSFVAANKLHQANYKGALAQSYRGETIYKLRLVEGRPRAVAEVIPASLWFPVVDPDNVTDILGHVIAWTKVRSESGLMGQRKTEYLRAEIHLPGSVHQRLWVLKDSKIAGAVDLTVLYDNPPPADQDTGVAEPLVIHVPNLELDDSPFGVDDYSEADTLFQELDVRLAQVSRVLDKHTDPNMSGPPLDEQDPQTGQAQMKAGGRYFEVQDGGTEPKYLVWDAQLQANFTYLDRIMQGLYIATDTNAAAFSMTEGGNFPSGAALKRLLMRPLARTNRKRLYWDDALKHLFRLAAQLERANGRSDAPDDLQVEIEWRDGLPEDALESAQIEQIRTGGKATSSVKSALRRLDGGSAESIDNELTEIAADEAQGAPPVPTGTQFRFGQTGEGA